MIVEDSKRTWAVDLFKLLYKLNVKSAMVELEAEDWLVRDHW
jgi:hypothetical protein